MNILGPYFGSSIGKKQVVAVTGLLLILFVIGHLAGNLFIFGGPEAYNAYAEKLAGLRPALYAVEFGLLVVFLVHMGFTALLVLENMRARGTPYRIKRPKGDRSLAAQWMPYTGSVILVFVAWHLLDFTFVDHAGPRSVLRDGESYGLYGVVYNAFASPWHSTLYIIAMACVGFHLYHGVESFLQTFGYNRPAITPLVKNLSYVLSLLVSIGFSAIPIYILMKVYLEMQAY